MPVFSNQSRGFRLPRTAPLYAAVLLACSAAPAWAGVVCDPATGSTAVGVDAYACGATDIASGFHSAAFGYGNIATGDLSDAFGHGNTASGYSSNAFGASNTASGDFSNAFGINNLASGDYSTAFGELNIASGDFSTASGIAGTAAGAGSVTVSGLYDRDGNGFVTFDRDLDGDGVFDASSETAVAIGISAVALGAGVQANGDYSSAVGVNNIASGGDSSAFGDHNTASGEVSNAFGYGNTVSGDFSSAFGINNIVNGNESLVFGLANTASGEASSAFGHHNLASGPDSSAFGNFSMASGVSSSAFGFNASAIGAGDIALAGWYDRDGDGAVTYDIDLDGDGMNDVSSETAAATGISAVALGAGVQANGNYSSALGVNATASADYSTAIGFGAVADREYTVSVGAAGDERQIVNLDAGTEDTDAVNLSQLYPMTTALGGGASYVGGMFTAPTYVIQGSNYNNVGAAFTAVDGRITDLYGRIDDAGGPAGPSGPEGPKGDPGATGPQGSEGPAGGGPRVVTYDSDTGDTLTLKGENGTTIANVADGVAATDAVNKGQMDAGDASTLQTANLYTDSKVAAWDDQFGDLREDVDQRFGEQGRRLNTVGALSAALALAAPDARVQGANQFSMGMGHYRDQQAISIGYSRLVSPRASVRVAAAFADGDNAAGVGFNVGW